MYLDYDDRLSYFYAIKVRLHIQARLYGKQLFTSGKFKVYPYKNVVAFYKHALFFYWSQRRSSFESNWVLYISSSFWLLGVESHDFSHAEKKRTACKPEQIHKKTKSFTENGPRLSFWLKTVVFCEFVQLWKHFLSFFLIQLEKNPVTQLPTAKN